MRPASSPMVISGIAGLYVAQSVIGGITWSALPAIMRLNGVPLDRIGLVSLIALPWAFKFLWAGAVERYRLPPVGRNRSRTVVAAGGIVSAGGLLLTGFLDPAVALPLLACLTIVAFAAATVDIACDGFAVETLARKQHGWGNAAQVGGAYLGSAIGGGLFLYLSGLYGWGPASWVTAGLLLLLGSPFLFGAARNLPEEVRSHVPSLGTALSRPELRRGLLVSAVFVLAQKSALGMIGPLLVDQGLDAGSLGLLNGLGSLFVGLGAAVFGGVCIRLFGVRGVLTVALLLQASCLALFSSAASTAFVPLAITMTAAVASTSGIMAFGFVALYAQFMRWSDPRQAGVDFTLFQCMDALVSLAGGVAAGQIAERFGYGPLFTVTSILAFAAVPLLWIATRRS
ncbi:MAG TPA: MFS transporter [Rhizobium sp.]|nr:MFS transporter [Rhizobium sp.]